jgi:hypothetical protein
MTATKLPSCVPLGTIAMYPVVVMANLWDRKKLEPQFTIVRKFSKNTPLMELCFSCCCSASTSGNLGAFC